MTEKHPIDQLNEMLYGKPAQTAKPEIEIPRESAAEIEAIIAQVSAHDKQRLEALQAELGQMKAARYSENAIKEKEKEIEAHERLAQSFSARYQERLSIRREYEANQAEAEHKRRAQKSEEEKNLFKEGARISWLNAGGHPDEFETVFPEMWKQELLRRTSANDARRAYYEEVRRMF